MRRLTVRLRGPALRLHAPCLLAALIALGSCGPSAKARRYDRKQAQESLARLESPGLVLGEFKLGGDAIVDGDTLRVDGLEETLRLLAIDTEETYKNKADRNASDADFAAYLAAKQSRSKRPIKAATPMGEEAKDFAKEFFAGVDTVRVERDHPKDIRGRYNRYLSYAFARKNGQWINYNVEVVRAGMSPYFTKYGYSRRFHDEFVAAEKEARAAGRGIWRPGCQCYPDYDERKVWWDARANFVREFERDAAGRDDFIVLGHFDAIRRLEEKMGQEVTVLGTVGELRYGDSGPSQATLSRRMFNDFPVIFFDRDVFLASGITRYKSEFVRVTGVVSEYQSKKSKRRTLQLQVHLPSQVVGSAVPGLPGDSTQAHNTP